MLTVPAGIGNAGDPEFVLTFGRDSTLIFAIAQTGPATVTANLVFSGRNYNTFIYCPSRNNNRLLLGTGNPVASGCVAVTLTAVPAIN